MLGIRTFIVSFLLCGASFAQDNYWPLDQGNTWVYYATHRGYVTLSVEREQEFHGVTYSLLKGLPSGDVWLRSDGHGKIYAMDPAMQQPEKLWYDFALPKGESYQTAIPGTGSRAVIHSRQAEYHRKIGTFQNALEIQYPQATQPGIGGETFLPWVGLAYRSELAGIVESHWELVYASIRGTSIITQPETAFTVGVDDQSQSVRLTLRHTGRNPLVLEFSSSQKYDIVITNDKGERVYVWSADKLFMQALSTVVVTGERTWIEPIPLKIPGRYVVEAYLTTVGTPAFRASIPFVIPEVTTQK